MPDNRKLRVFLCHSSQDKPIVREIYQRLNAEGWIDPWLDEEKLLPGMDWDLEIEKAVEAADAVIVCLSNHSVTKEGYVQRELRFVLDIALEKLEGEIFIIPLRLDDCQSPRRLRSWQYVDCFPSSQKERSFQLILKSLELRKNKLGIQISPIAPKEYVYGGILFMFVRYGTYLTGDGERNKNTGTYEKTKHKLLMPYDYCIGRDPISNEQYAIQVLEKGQNFYFPKGRNDHPVTGVTWNAAMDFVDWITKRYGAELPHGYIFDLPSAEEWEKAARGLDGRIYPWGDNFDKHKCNTRECNIGDTTPVGKYSPDGDSTYGAKDMAGNVWEWTRSSFGDVSNSLTRIMCGGSYGDEAIYARCAFRMEYPIATSASSFGFRLAIVPKDKNLRNEVYFPTL